jgi:1-acyl-sn-glycerol-3-phosphate acyltransferase
MGYWLVKAVLAPILRLLFRPTVQGEQNLPETGAAILAGQPHVVLDNFMIPLVVPRRVTFLAKSDYFTGRGPSRAGCSGVLPRRRP